MSVTLRDAVREAVSSKAADRTRVLTGGVFLLAAFVWPGAGYAQAPLEPEAADRVHEILEQIEEAEARDGINSPELIEPWTALGLYHAEHGRHHRAAAAFRRARHVVRVNHGFSSLEEAPLLRQLVLTEEARGNLKGAWELEQALLELVRQHAGDMRTFPIYRELADKRSELLERYYAGEIPPQIVLGCYYAGDDSDEFETGRRVPLNDSCHSGSRHTVLVALLREIRRYQARAVEALLQNGRYASDELENIALDVVRSNYRYADSFVGIVFGPITAYEPRNAAEQRRRAQMLVHRADMHVLHSHRAGRSHEYDSMIGKYEQAHAQLESAGMAPAAIDEMLAPATPVMLPTTEPNPLASNATPESVGHVDVAFEITRYGKSRHVEVLETSTNAARDAINALVREIRRGSFRPRIVDGRVVDNAEIVVRYGLGGEQR